MSAGPEDFDTINRFVVATNGAGVVIMNPPRGAMRREEALSLVAWVAVMANLADDEISSAMRAVEAT